jgi:hypothetical protein
MLSSGESCEPQTDFEPLEVTGCLPSSQCMVRSGDGRRELTILAVAGHQPGIDGEPATPLIEYRLSLVSSDQTWERDLALFRRFVVHLILAPSSIDE